jgi:1-acyl-sn-glycerol-3-phosphate acyltransferase
MSVAMSRLRAISRIVAMLATTAVLYPIWFIRRSRRKAIVRRWHASMARILGVRVTIEGHLPTDAVFLVSNHLGYLDIFLIGGILEVLFIAKSEIRHWPGMGGLASTTGTIFIDRRSRRDTLRVSSVIESAIRDRHAVVLFPEGTTTAQNVRLLPFRSSLLEVAALNALPVHTAAIRYSVPEAEWRNDDPFGPHFWRLLHVPRIDATLRFGGSTVSSDRKELAGRLWEEVSRLLGAAPQEPADR